MRNVKGSLVKRTDKREKEKDTKEKKKGEKERERERKIECCLLVRKERRLLG